MVSISGGALGAYGNTAPERGRKLVAAPGGGGLHFDPVSHFRLEHDGEPAAGLGFLRCAAGEHGDRFHVEPPVCPAAPVLLAGGVCRPEGPKGGGVPGVTTGIVIRAIEFAAEQDVFAPGDGVERPGDKLPATGALKDDEFVPVGGDAAGLALATDREGTVPGMAAEFHLALRLGGRRAGGLGFGVGVCAGGAEETRERLSDLVYDSHFMCSGVPALLVCWFPAGRRDLSRRGN